MLIGVKENSSFLEALRNQGRVIFALILRGMRTRFFGSGLGYVLAVAWPLSHILILVILFNFKSRVSPVGDSVALFAATGAIPFMIFSYISRFMMINTIYSKPLLSFPEVKLNDILLAGVILEILSALIVVIILFFIGILLGIDVWPKDIVQFYKAISAAIVLGVGFGLLGSVIVLNFPFWLTITALLKIVLYASSGVFFVADNLPNNLISYASYIPTLQLVEWFRSSYYDGYGANLLDQNYTITFGVSLLFIGLLADKIIGKG